MLVRVSLVPPVALERELAHLIDRLEQLPGVHPFDRRRVEVPVVRLDHVEATDVRRMIAALEPALAGVAVPHVHGQGLRTLPTARGSIVAVNLHGDVAALNRLAHAVGEAVASVGLYPEQPVFHPCVLLARISDALPGALGVAEREIEHWLGSSWPVREVCVAQETGGGLSGAAPAIRDLAWLPVGSAVPTG